MKIHCRRRRPHLHFVGEIAIVERNQLRGYSLYPQALESLPTNPTSQPPILEPYLVCVHEYFRG